MGRVYGQSTDWQATRSDRGLPPRSGWACYFSWWARAMAFPLRGTAPTPATRGPHRSFFRGAHPSVLAAGKCSGPRWQPWLLTPWATVGAAAAIGRWAIRKDVPSSNSAANPA